MPITLDDVLRSHTTGRAVVMGILNVTPDSFSDGSHFVDPALAVARARQMIQEGADVIDIGAESTRPGSERVPGDAQIARLAEVLPAVCGMGAIVSIDTTLAAVAEWALEKGAQIVNDISAGQDDPSMLSLAASRGCGLVLMHMQGSPRTMQEAPRYDDVVAEVRQFLQQRLVAAEQAGVRADRCILDPGIGFGKTIEHNLALLGGVGQLASLGRPVLIGASRKRFVGAITGQDCPLHRMPGSLGAALAARADGASIFRVHDVAPTRQALALFDRARPPRTTA